MSNENERLPVGTRVLWRRRSNSTVWEDTIQEYSPSKRYVCMDEEEWVRRAELVVLEVLPANEPRKEIDWDKVELDAAETIDDWWKSGGLKERTERLRVQQQAEKPSAPPEEIDWDDIERHAREMMRRSFPNTRSMVKGAMTEALRDYFGEAETAEQALREVRREVGNWMATSRRGIMDALSKYDKAFAEIEDARLVAFMMVNRLLRDKLKEVRGE